MQRIIWASFLLLASSALFAVHAQNQQSPAPAGDKGSTADYPRNRTGILIQGTEWTPVANQNPTKTKTAHSLAAGLSYGIVPAKIVAEYRSEEHTSELQS